MPTIQLGPFVFTDADFTSGLTTTWAPAAVEGPLRSTYVIEHSTPNAEGGPVEYLGSRQSTIQLRGFLTNFPTVLSGAGAVVSGPLTAPSFAMDADTARDFLLGLRSGAQIVRIESNASPVSGIARWYVNDFYFITNIQIGYERGRAYPYYPYTIELRQANTSGRSYTESGSVTSNNIPTIAGNYLSGYLWGNYLSGYRPKGETLVGIGVFLNSATSGRLRLAVYDGTDDSFQVGTHRQTVHSGWNWFPLRPTFTTVSGRAYWLAIMGSAADTSGFTVARGTTATNAGFSRQSGLGFETGLWPATLAFGTLSGSQPWSIGISMVV